MGSILNQNLDIICIYLYIIINKTLYTQRPLVGFSPVSGVLKHTLYTTTIARPRYNTTPRYHGQYKFLAYAVIEPLQPTAQQPKVSAVIGLLAVFTFMIHVNFI